MFGHENRLPVDIVLGSPDDDEERSTSYDEYVEEQKNKFQGAYQTVRGNIGIAASRRKERYDAGVKIIPLSVGQWVWYYYPRRRVGLSPKLQKWYSGPFLITRFIDSHNVVIQRSKQGRPAPLNRRRCVCTNDGAANKCDIDIDIDIVRWWFTKTR